MLSDVRLKIAVVGGGVAGIASAHLLQRHHEVTLFEKNDYVGGHTRTIVIDDGPDKGTPVDTGFIVLNDRTYPLLMRFLAGLGVPIRKVPAPKRPGTTSARKTPHERRRSRSPTK